MQIILNNWRLVPSLNALVHTQTGEVQRLGEFHYILLETLVNHAGEVLSRSTLINEVWKNRVVGSNSLPTAIYALRVALGDDGRLQEIIKTVPKKGYLFNKEFITVIDDAVDEPGSIEADTALSEKACPPVEEKEEPGCATALTNTPAVSASKLLFSGKVRVGTVLITSIIVILLLIVIHLVTLKNGSKKSEPVLSLKNESLTDHHNLKIVHLHSGDISGHTTQLERIMPDALNAMDALLHDHRMSAALYYNDSVGKLSVSTIIKDTCQNQHQLVMSIRNWQSDAPKLSSVFYEEIKRTINEMPTCK